MTDESKAPAGARPAKAAGSIPTMWAVIAGLGGLAIGGVAVALTTSGSTSDREEVEKIVREYVLENPEILPEAMERLQQKESGKVVKANRAAIETPFAGAWAGAADGDVVLVEFFDYACGYCRKSNEDVERLLKEDSKLKVVWRDWPVLGPQSELAAQASLAAAQAGRFRAYYDRLFASGRPTERSIAEAQQAAGLTPDLVRQAAASPEVRAELGKNHEIARALGASGTPTFIVGDRVLQGAVGYDALKEAIAQARSAAG